jgi:hypothetical protein
MKAVSFNAPWGAPLALMTSVCALICLGLPVPGLMICFGSAGFLRVWGIAAVPSWCGLLLTVVPVATLLISAIFMVRGYVLTDEELIIKRLGWSNRMDLRRLESVSNQPNILDGSIRIFGNGGLFSFTGRYRNKNLGSYRAFVTDVKKAVVLRFNDKTIVVTPDDPEKFMNEINTCVPHGA